MRDHETSVSLYCAVCSRLAVSVVVPNPTIFTRPDDMSIVAKDGSDDVYDISPLLSFIAITLKDASP